MKSIRQGLAGVLVAGGLFTAMANLPASAADPAAAAAPAGGPQGWGHRHPGGPDGPWHLYKQLGLSPDQQASIKAIMTAAKPRMQSLHEQMHANHVKLMQTKPDDPNYGNVVAEVAQSEATLASQRTQQGAELRTQMYAVLNAAQKTQLTALEAQWAANPPKRHWGHGPHEAGPDGPPPDRAP